MSIEHPHIKKWLSALPWGIAVLYGAMAWLAHPSFRLTFFGDVAQLSLSLVLVAAFAANALAAEDRARRFWWLMTLGSVFWLASQVVWTYYELWERMPSPDPGLGAVLLFLHLAPMTAALTVMPHKGSGIPSLTTLSMGMILTWWLFLYTYLVVPWQYMHASPALCSRAFNSLYTVEDLVFMALLVVLSFHATGGWRKLYLGLLMGSAVYTAGSVVLDGLIDQKHYYTGSRYDLLFILPVAWLAYIAASFPPEPGGLESEVPIRSDGRIGWVTLVALLSVPCLLVWNNFSGVPEGVRDFRLVAGLAASAMLALMLFAKQYVLAGKLSEALTLSEYNVAELMQLREQLERKATHDSMTGLLNRPTVIMSLERELARARREHGRVAALLLDLDHFKSINDNYGHHAGDTAIAFAATCMEECVREHDYVGRYGGEEFLIVVADCDERLAREIAERIRVAVESEAVTFDGHELEITATIGIAISEDGEDSESLLRRADAALYAGKEQGRNLVACAMEAFHANRWELA